MPNSLAYYFGVILCLNLFNWTQRLVLGAKGCEVCRCVPDAGCVPISYVMVPHSHRHQFARFRQHRRMRADGTAESGKDPSLNDGWKSREVASRYLPVGPPWIPYSSEKSCKVSTVHIRTTMLTCDTIGLSWGCRSPPWVPLRNNRSICRGKSWRLDSPGECNWQIQIDLQRSDPIFRLYLPIAFLSAVGVLWLLVANFSPYISPNLKDVSLTNLS